MTEQYKYRPAYQDDRCGDHIQPRDGFRYPEPGDEIVALKDFETAAHGGEKTVKSGDVGKVRENRKPGTFDQVHGYMGLVVSFHRVRHVYPAGFVIPWDKASDPEQFCFRKQDPAVLVPEPS